MNDQPGNDGVYTAHRCQSCHEAGITMRNLFRTICFLCLVVCEVPTTPAQSYAIGADVSFLAKCEQDGVVFKENGQLRDVLAVLREHHYNWVRLRIFHDPSASADKLPNDLNYTIALAKRAKALGFNLLLGSALFRQLGRPRSTTHSGGVEQAQAQAACRACFRLHARHDRRLRRGGSDAANGAGGERDYTWHALARRKAA